jgi:hypothetical protein
MLLTNLLHCSCHLDMVLVTAACALPPCNFAEGKDTVWHCINCSSGCACCSGQIMHDAAVYLLTFHNLCILRLHSMARIQSTASSKTFM